MMKINFIELGQTQIDDDEKRALIPSLNTLEPVFKLKWLQI